MGLSVTAKIKYYDDMLHVSRNAYVVWQGRFVEQVPSPFPLCCLIICPLTSKFISHCIQILNKS